MIISDVQILPQVQLIAPTTEGTDLVEDEEYAGLDKSAVQQLQATEATAAEGNKILP